MLSNEILRFLGEIKNRSYTVSISGGTTFDFSLFVNSFSYMLFMRDKTTSEKKIG